MIAPCSHALMMMKGNTFHPFVLVCLVVDHISYICFQWPIQGSNHESM